MEPIMKKLPIALAGITLTLLLGACGGNTTRPDSTASAGSVVESQIKGTVHVQQLTPYAKNGHIDTAVRQECDINQQLPTFISRYATENGVDVVLEPTLNTAAKGHNLVIEIVRATSQGNAFIGHRKYTEIKAVLYKDGKEIADLKAARRSGGGFFAGYKSSCSVMGRTVKTLGQDVALWLKAPGPGMHKGDI